MVTICTASLTVNNSTFSPRSVFVCFVWIWEQTTISHYPYWYTLVRWNRRYRRFAWDFRETRNCWATLHWDLQRISPKSVKKCGESGWKL